MLAGSLRNRSLWTPERLNPALWLDANDSSTITLVNGAISEWRDKSGNNCHATQATANNRPLLVADGLNGTDIITFDGINNILNTQYSISTNNTIFFVAKNNTQTNTGQSLLRPVVSTNDIYGIGGIRLDAGQELDFYITNTRVPRVNFSWLNNEVIIATSTYNGSVLIGYKNSVQQGSLSINVTLTNNVNIGGDTQILERKFKGNISQVIIFNRVLTRSEREQVEGYLAWHTKLMSNLPTNHPYKNYPPRGL